MAEWQSFSIAVDSKYKMLLFCFCILFVSSLFVFAYFGYLFCFVCGVFASFFFFFFFFFWGGGGGLGVGFYALYLF